MEENGKLVFWFVVIGILIMIFACGRGRLERNKTSEAFDVLGAAGEFRDQYFTCLAQCEKTDPTDRLSQNPWACGMYCDDIVAQSVAQGKQLGKLVSVDDICQNNAKGRRIRLRVVRGASALGMWINTANSSARIVSLGFQNAFLRACLLKARIVQEGIHGFSDLLRYALLVIWGERSFLLK